MIDSTDRGTLVRSLLEAGGLGQSEAARALGINPRTMRRYVAGDPLPRTVELALRYLVTLPPNARPYPDAQTTARHTAAA